MNKIKWCLKAKDGIELVEPSSNLAEAYLLKAQSSLQTLRQVSDRDWKISTAYYTMYFSLYSILMKIGIKCEIHTCTLEFMKQFLSEFFIEDGYKIISDAFKSRVDAQYYINRAVPDEVYRKIVAKASDFMLKCKEIVNKINEKKIIEIRNKVKNY